MIYSELLANEKENFKILYDAVSYLTVLRVLPTQGGRARHS
jgi:hypothetical protein